MIKGETRIAAHSNLHEDWTFKCLIAKCISFVDYFKGNHSKSKGNRIHFLCGN